MLALSQMTKTCPRRWRSSYAQDLKPMAISLAFGELISTAVILLLMPAAYVAWEERRRVRFARALVPESQA
jgi:hypothetical protein